MSDLLLALLLLFSVADKVLAASARPVSGSPSFIYSIGGRLTALGGACCLKTAHGTPADSGRGPLLAQPYRDAPRPAAQVGGRSVSFVSWGLSAPPGVLFQGRGQLLGPTCLQMSEKRYKEQLMGKKFTSVGRSSIARHYRIQGRGGGKPRVRKATGLPTNPIILPTRRCMLLGKMDNRKARSISHSGVRTHRVQRVNLAWKRLWWPEGGHYVWLRLSMKGLKTIKKYGLQRAADKFKLNLKDKRLYGGVSHRGKYRQSGLQEAALRAAGALQAGGPSLGSAAAGGLPDVEPPLAAGPAGAAVHTAASSAAQASAALASTSAAAPVESVVSGISFPT